MNRNEMNQKKTKTVIIKELINQQFKLSFNLETVIIKELINQQFMLSFNLETDF
jgi:hypothetical protein